MTPMFKSIMFVVLALVIFCAASVLTGCSYNLQPGVEEGGCSLSVRQSDAGGAGAMISGGANACTLAITGSCYKDVDVDLDKLKELCEAID